MSESKWSQILWETGSKLTGSIRKRGFEFEEFKLDQFMVLTIKSKFPFIGLTPSKRR